MQKFLLSPPPNNIGHNHMKVIPTQLWLLICKSFQSKKFSKNVTNDEIKYNVQTYVNYFSTKMKIFGIEMPFNNHMR
jgi:hypothetical protein